MLLTVDKIALTGSAIPAYHMLPEKVRQKCTVAVLVPLSKVVLQMPCNAM